MDDGECLKHILQGGPKAMPALQTFFDRYDSSIEVFIDLRYQDYQLSPDDPHEIATRVFEAMKECIGSGFPRNNTRVLRLPVKPSQEETYVWIWDIVLACANDYVRKPMPFLQEDELPRRGEWDDKTLLCFMELGEQIAKWAFCSLYDRYATKFASRIRRLSPHLTKEDIEDSMQEAFITIWKWATQSNDR